jgi:4-amino-4-deoxy-L-arabinose transferase-like glycosyltransferase
MLSKFFLGVTLSLKTVVHRASAPHRYMGKVVFYLSIPIVASLPFFFFLYRLGAYPLRDNNEGLYAEIAREMVETGNVIVPHLLGAPYIEKPPLLYWLMALSFRVFGPSETSARLVSALPMACLAFVLFMFCRGLGHPRAGLYAALILSTALPVVLLSRTVLFDPLLTVLLAGGLLAFLQRYLGRRKTWIRLAALLLALATLEKGGVAPVLAAGIVGTFLWLRGDFRALRSSADRVAIGLFFALAAPWHIFASFQQEGFAWFYFFNEHLLRFLGLREPHDYHSGPPYYYLLRIVLLLLPWTPFLWLLIRPPGIRDPVAKLLIRFCQAWILFPLLFFSLSQAKADYYLLVVAPAGALWLAIVLEHRLDAGEDKVLSRCLRISMAICAAALAAFLFSDHVQWPSRTNVPMAILGVLACAAAFGLGSRLFSMSSKTSWSRDAALAGIGIAMMPILSIVLRTAEEKSVYTSSRDVAKLINRHGNVQPLVFVYRDFEDAFSSLPFYLGHTVKVIDSGSRDLQFGCRVSSSSETPCISTLEFDRYSERFPVAVAVRNTNVESFRRLLAHDKWRIEVSGNNRVFFNY